MPSQKNQHYVPRCALRPFSLDTEGRAINTYILAAQSSVQNAPLKSQCSKDYFYGKDLKAEKALGDLEGHYARVLTLLTEGSNLSEADEDWLRLFTVIQSRRTERAVAEVAAFQESLVDTIFQDHADQRPPELTHQQLVALSMNGGLAMHDYARDLKFVVLRNKTPVDFIISDNPAMTTNKLAFEKWDDKSFGIINSGAILVLPLTPRLSALFFDIGIYSVSIPRGTRFVDVSSPTDIAAMNHFQHLNAHRSLYFSNWDDREAIAKQASAAARTSGEVKHEITTLIHDQSISGPGQAFRQGTEEEQSKSAELMIKGSVIHPAPAQWPSFLKYRPKPIMFSNETAVGFVRKEEYLRIRR
jgi:hypothetical protein